MTKEAFETIKAGLEDAISYVRNNKMRTNQIKYNLIIDTNLYSGNFEREMCAFITGQIGDCGVGSKIAGIVGSDIERFFNTLGKNIETIIRTEGCEHGNFRPVSIAITPGWSNEKGIHYHDTKHKYPAYQSVRIYLMTKPSKEIYEFFKDRAYKFPEFIIEHPEIFTYAPKDLEIIDVKLEKVEKISTREDI